MRAPRWSSVVAGTMLCCLFGIAGCGSASSESTSPSTPQQASTAQASSAAAPAGGPVLNLTLADFVPGTATLCTQGDFQTFVDGLGAAPAKATLQADLAKAQGAGLDASSAEVLVGLPQATGMQLCETLKPGGYLTYEAATPLMRSFVFRFSGDDGAKSAFAQKLFGGRIPQAAAAPGFGDESIGSGDGALTWRSGRYYVVTFSSNMPGAKDAALKLYSRTH